jgi:Gpi18-like mannosyltransferase
MFHKIITKWFKNNREILIFLLFAFLVWRVWLQVFLWLGWFVLPLKEILLGGGDKFFSHPGLWAWANFDGEHYLAIAHHGYGNFEQAFFPFYPWLIRTLVFPFKQTLFALLFSGLFISHLSFIIALFLFYLLIRLDYDKKIAQTAIFFLLLFPTSFFFGAVYTESLFLALALGSFYAARCGKWWIAGILGAMASATRLVGIFLLPALLWEWWEQNKIKNEKLKIKNLLDLAPILLVSAGLLYYMRFLAVNYHDPLMFFHVQPAFGAQRVADKIILLYQVFWRYFKMIATTKWDPLYFTVWLEFLTASWFLGFLVFAYLKKIRFSYIVFASLAYLIPTLTGTFSSMPRYVLVLFPCFISMALLKNRIIKILLFTFYFLLLVVSTIFFTRGYFVG